MEEFREIKPGEINHCAECGSEAVMYYNGAEFMIWCTKCKNASYALTQEKVLLEWNALNPESEVKPFTETPKEVTDALPKLKPCPFCGCKEIDVEESCGDTYIQCSGCGITSNLYKSKRNAVEFWNRRAGE